MLSYVGYYLLTGLAFSIVVSIVRGKHPNPGAIAGMILLWPAIMLSLIMTLGIVVAGAAMEFILD